MQHYTLWQYRLWSFQGRDTNLERFLVKNQLLSIEIIEFWELEYVVASCQKLGIILENKVILKLILSKNVSNKNILLNSYCSMKKNQKDSDDFDIEKLTLKVKFWHFLTSPHYTNSQNSMVSFDSDDSQMTHRLL